MMSDDAPVTAEELADVERLRPRTRGDCQAGPRPCPWYGCRFHLGLDLKSSGAPIAADLDAVPESCALDVADRGPVTLEEVATLLPALEGSAAGTVGLSRERVRQIELQALEKVRKRLAGEGFEAADMVDTGSQVGSSIEERAFEALRRARGWQAASEVAATLGERASDVRTALKKLVDGGRLIRVQQGVFLYALPGTEPERWAWREDRRVPLRDRVLAVLTADWLTADGIAHRLDMTRGNVNVALSGLTREGVVERREGGRGAHGGRYFEYRLPQPTEEHEIMSKRDEVLAALTAEWQTTEGLGLEFDVTYVAKLLRGLEAEGLAERDPAKADWRPGMVVSWRRAEPVAASPAATAPPSTGDIDDESAHLRAELEQTRAHAERLDADAEEELERVPLTLRAVARQTAHVIVRRREELVRQTLVIEGDEATVERAVQLVELFVEGRHVDAVALVRAAHRKERAA